MDFDSLARRDLQFFCKRNKIPANMTNIAMADALKSLEIVEGIDDFMNQSPTSVAKNLPSAARTAARRKASKDETESSELVTRSCYVTSKSLAGEMEQENRNTNVLPPGRRRSVATSVAMKLEVTDMETEAKTPAARSTRRAQVAASTKKEESVQRVYSTRRSVKLLEEYMADLSLKTKESINVPKTKNEDVEKKDSPEGSKLQEKTEEAEVISVRDLNDSLEKEWDGSKNDPDLDILYGDLGDTTFFDANTTKEELNGIESNTTVPASDSFVLVKGEESLTQEDDFVVVDHAASTTTNIVASNTESESEQMKSDSKTESEETQYETDPWEDDDSGGVVDDSNIEVFESKVSASPNVSKVNSVPTVLIADEPKELDSEGSEPEEEEICVPDELILIADDESEVSQVSDIKKAQASFSPRAEKEHESDSEWSDFEIDEIEENSFGSEELDDSESEAAPVSDKKKTPALVADKNKENVEEEMVLDNNGERKAEAEAKKNNEESLKDVSNDDGERKEEAKAKKNNEERLKDVSMRQLTKMLKELAVKSKSRPQHKYLE